MGKQISIFSAVLVIFFLLVGTASALSISGSISPDSWGGAYYRNTSVTFTPNSGPVTISGTVDLSCLVYNGAIMIGLIDKQYYDGGNSGWMGGAYAYFADVGNNRIGPSDGNFGGEIVQTYGLTSNDIINFSVTIGNGMIDLSFEGSTYSDTYGEVKALNSKTAYAWDEFEYGAYFGIDLWNNGACCPITFELDVTGGAPVPEPATMFLFASGLFGLAGFRRRFKKA